jgi:hypothetical protein
MGNEKCCVTQKLIINQKFDLHSSVSDCTWLFKLAENARHVHFQGEDGIVSVLDAAVVVLSAS